MVPRHRTLFADIGLRIAGLALLLGARIQAAHLHRLIEATGPVAPDGVTPGLFLLSAACFVSVALGMAPLLLGAGLWRPVTVAQRWQG